jgi:hypothetical protein
MITDRELDDLHGFVLLLVRVFSGRSSGTEEPAGEIDQALG